MSYDWDEARNNIDYYEEHQGNAEIRLAFEIRIYFQSDLQRNAADILRFYERAREIATIDFNCWFTPFSVRYASDGLVHFRKSNKTMQSYLAKWVEQEKWDKSLAMELHAGESDRAVSDTSVQICSEPYYPGYLRLLLPIETIDKGSEAILKMVEYLVGDMNYLSGYAGPGVNVFEPAYQKLTRSGVQIPDRLQQYYCVDFTSPFVFKKFEEYGLLNIAWLTLLGKAASKKSKLRKGLFNRVPENITTHKMGKGICVQTNVLPTLGEVGIDDIDNYKKVCKLIGKAKLPGEEVHPFDSLGTTEITVAWVDRFAG